jgi:hypothetical protein
MKNMLQPNATQIELLQNYILQTLWGSEADRGANNTVQDSNYGIRASMFYSGMPGFNYTTQPDWDLSRSLTRWRSYNYPHPTATYWALYRLARYYQNLLPAASPDWSWYLGQAANTTMLGMAKAGGYNAFGLMVGSVFAELLRDLQREGWLGAAQDLEVFMQGRAAQWAQNPFPFGSEMPWDSTGQEEVRLDGSIFGRGCLSEAFFSMFIGLRSRLGLTFFNAALSFP